MILISNYFKCDNEERYKEYLYCIRKNLDNEYIDKFIMLVFGEEVCEIESGKIEYVRCGKIRPTFLDYFKYVSEKHKKDIVIISNLDIFFDNTLSFAEKIDFNKMAICLLRWEFVSDGNIYLRDNECATLGKTQDAWIFKIPAKFDDLDLDFSLGIPRCDHRINYELSRRYSVINCPWDIKAYHYHNSDFRGYDQTKSLDGTGKSVVPEKIKKQ